MTVLSSLDAAGRRRSPATLPGYHAGRPPRNKRMCYPADPPTVEDIVAVMRKVWRCLPLLCLNSHLRAAMLSVAPSAASHGKQPSGYASAHHASSSSNLGTGTARGGRAQLLPRRGCVAQLNPGSAAGLSRPLLGDVVDPCCERRDSDLGRTGVVLVAPLAGEISRFGSA